MKKSVKHILFILMAIALVLIFFEISSRFFWIVKERSWVSSADVIKKHFPQSFNVPGCVWSDQIQTHPYWGIAYKLDSPCATVPVNSQGLSGPEIPQVRDPHYFTVLVVGGSVAETLAAHLSEQGMSSLQMRVQDKFVDSQGRKIRFINASIAAGQQPMQVLATLYYGRVVDAVISVEGYNEYRAIQNEKSIFGPTHVWTEVLVRDFNGGRLSGLLAQSLLDLKSKILRSYLANSLFLVSTALIIQDAVNIKSLDSGSNQLTRNLQSWRGSQSKEQRIKDSLDMTLATSEVSKILGVPFVAYLQPTPRSKKVLSAEETSVVGDLKTLDGYADFLRQSKASMKGRVQFTDLTQIFDDTSDTVFLDPIHNNLIGKRIFSDRIVSDLAQRFKWRVRP